MARPSGLNGIRVMNADKVVVEHVDISNSVYGIYNTRPAQLNVIDSYLHDNRHYGVLKVVTTGRLMLDQSQISITARGDDVYLAPSRHRHGVGATCIRTVEEVARRA